MALPDWVLYGGVDQLVSGTMPAGLNRVTLPWPPRNLTAIFEVPNYLSQPSVIADGRFVGDIRLVNVRLDWFVSFALVHSHVIRYPEERVHVPLEALAIQAAFYTEVGDGYQGVGRPRVVLNAPEGTDYVWATLNHYVNF